MAVKFLVDKTQKIWNFFWVKKEKIAAGSQIIIIYRHNISVVFRGRAEQREVSGLVIKKK